MMTEVDCNSNFLSAELEVKKLQELVRNLERQNEELRIQASDGTGGHRLPQFRLLSPKPTRPYQASSGSLLPPEQTSDYVEQHITGDKAETEEDEEEGDDGGSALDEYELLDLGSLCFTDEDEETWLYELSKARRRTDKSLTPLQWCQQVLNNLKTDRETTRQTLSFQLNQGSRWCKSMSSSSPSSSPGPPFRQNAGVSPMAVPLCLTSRPTEKHTNQPTSLPAIHRTQSPLGKELSPVAERTPTFLPHSASRSSSLGHSVLTPLSSVGSGQVVSEVEDTSTTMGFKLQDFTDVQVMARMQEESLRQYYVGATSVLAHQRSQSFTLELSASPDLEEGKGDNDEDCSHPLQLQPHHTCSHTFSSIRELHRSPRFLVTPPSTPSTRTLPLAGIAIQPPDQGQSRRMELGSRCFYEGKSFRQESDKQRRSTPNRVRAPVMPNVPIPVLPLLCFVTSLPTRPRSLSTLSAPYANTWKDGCY